LTLQPELTVEIQRRRYDEFFSRLVVDPSAEVGAIDDGPVPALRIRYRADAPRHILFVHGGGYVCGHAEGASSVAALLAREADAEVLLPRYRLAPEHPHPTAVQDVVAMFRWLLAGGVDGEVVDPARVAVVGESAGGGLALAAVGELVRAGTPPAALVTWSPLADLDLTGLTGKSNIGSDPMVTEAVLNLSVAAYLQGQDPRTPSASPVYAELAGFPPLLIQVCANEGLLDDSTLLAANARAAGVPVTLEIADGQPHVFQYLAARRPEALAAVERTAAFVVAHTCRG
jgi:acetyl esterase/lipase